MFTVGDVDALAAAICDLATETAKEYGVIGRSSSSGTSGLDSLVELQLEIEREVLSGASRIGTPTT